MNQLRDLPWSWIAGAAAVLVILVFLFRRPGGGSKGGYGGSVGGYGTDPAAGHGSAASSEQRALLSAANALRDALDRQSREMQELRTFWSKRLDELNGRIAELARAQTHAQTPTPRDEREPYAERRQGLGGGGYSPSLDAEMYGAESVGRAGPTLEPAWSPGPGDQAVEVRDGVLVLSRSLPPTGYVSVTGSGHAKVYLNADVQLSEFSLPKWAGFFDLQGGAKPYAAYRTIRPAEVRWEEGTGRGELISKGVAEAI